MYCFERMITFDIFQAHGLSDELLKQRQVKFVDIRVDDGSQTPASVVAEFASQRSGRGPLANDWIQTVEPVMCCYKLTTIKCSIPFFSGKVESTVESVSFLFKRGPLFLITSVATSGNLTGIR